VILGCGVAGGPRGTYGGESPSPQAPGGGGPCEGHDLPDFPQLHCGLECGL